MLEALSGVNPMIRCLRLSLAVVCTCLTFSAAAAPKKKSAPEAAKPAPSLRAQAETEATSSGVATAKASEASVSGLLSLKDPGLDAAASPWTWDLGLRLQNLEPRGVVSLPGDNSYDLAQAGGATTPWLDLGGKRLVLTRGPINLRLGGRAGVGYMSRRTEVVFASGFREDEARLSTGLATAGLFASLQPVTAPAWEFELGWQQGLISYAQGGNNDVVNFSRQARFSGPQAGLLFWVDEDWGVNLDYVRRSLSQDSDVNVQQDNYSFGARIIW
jgi:hypothetical protein